MCDLLQEYKEGDAGAKQPWQWINDGAGAAYNGDGSLHSNGVREHAKRTFPLPSIPGLPPLDPQGTPEEVQEASPPPPPKKRSALDARADTGRK